MTKAQVVIISICGLLLVAAIVGIFWYVSQTQLSVQLNTLFSVLLTVFSIVLSIIVSQFYYEASRQKTIKEIKADYNKSNKLYSQKAAEKVDNLSNELAKLSIYLQQSVEDEGEYDPETALLVRGEKIRSSIHIVETLKSINEKSLSDWLGVLGVDDIEEETSKREEAREERESDLRDILDNYRSVVKINGLGSTLVTGTPFDRVDGDTHLDIGELNKKIDKLATSIVGTPVKLTDSVPKERTDRSCPHCGHVITYRQRPVEKSVRRMKCQVCGAKLESTYTLSDGFELKLREIPEDLPAKVLPEADVQAVKELLPEQPWPKGTSRVVAEKLGMQHSDVDRAVRELIKRGDFLNQVDGVLFEPVKEKKSIAKKPAIKKATSTKKP
jgi:predicted RNA-binding Zn-ribbon protein involved in translation (DUF1610 family)